MGAALAAWSAASARGGQLDPVPPLLAPLLAHGQVFVSGATDTMFAAASGAFATICGDLSEAEARRGEAFTASALGRRLIYRNDCAGVYDPFLLADAYFDRSHFHWFAAVESQTPCSESSRLRISVVHQVRP